MSSIIVHCIECGEPMELTTPKNQELPPFGKCPRCKLLHYASWDSAGNLCVYPVPKEEHA